MLKKAEGSTASHAVSKNRSECCDEHWCPRTLLHARVRDPFSGTRVRGGSVEFSGALLAFMCSRACTSPDVQRLTTNYSSKVFCPWMNVSCAISDLLHLRLRVRLRLHHSS